MNETVESEIELEESPQDSMERRLASSGLLLGLFWVVFLWSFWKQGFNALGVNAGAFLVLFALVQLKRGADSQASIFKEIQWEVPLFLLAGSYFLYENPFIKACNIFAIPAIFGFLLLRRSASNPDRMFSDGAQTVFLTFYALLGPVGHIQRAFAAQWKWFTRGGFKLEKLKSPVARSVIKGVSIFLVLAILIIVPLLSAADATFAAAFEEIYVVLEELIITIFGEEFLWKLLVILLVSVVVLASSFAWAVDPEEVLHRDAVEKERDSIAAGIILAGVMLLYLLFLAIQLERLFLSSLPLDFKATESYVKQGFWQLVFLSTINLYLVFMYFKKTSQQVQYILLSFTFVSLALLFSAAHRMIMYVVYYGLSYEKFYASYTVLFCMALFGLLLYAFYTPTVRNILRDAVFLLVWMYALVGLFPVEKTIIVFNSTLHKSEASRIDLRDMNMLSLDVLGYVKEHGQLLKGREAAESGRWRDIDRWIARREAELKAKRWYEHTLASSLLLLRSK